MVPALLSVKRHFADYKRRYGASLLLRILAIVGDFLLREIEADIDSEEVTILSLGQRNIQFDFRIDKNVCRLVAGQGNLDIEILARKPLATRAGDGNEILEFRRVIRILRTARGQELNRQRGSDNAFAVVIHVDAFRMD